MAGDWIKMRADLQTHPKVVRIASALHADRLRAVGGLHAVWCLFDAHSVDGVLEGYTPAALDSLIGCEGFSAAMSAVGWLEVSEDSLALPRFDEHNGKSAKRRATEAERKRRERSEEDPHEDRNVSASHADKRRSKSGPEKRREDLSSSGEEERGARAARPAAPDGVQPQTWADWLDLRKKKRAPVTKTVVDGAIAEAAKAGLSLDAFLQAWCYRGSQGLQADWLKPAEIARFGGKPVPAGKSSAIEAANSLVAAGFTQPEIFEA